MLLKSGELIANRKIALPKRVRYNGKESRAKHDPPPPPQIMVLVIGSPLNLCVIPQVFIPWKSFHTAHVLFNQVPVRSKMSVSGTYTDTQANQFVSILWVNAVE